MLCGTIFGFLFGLGLLEILVKRDGLGLLNCTSSYLRLNRSNLGNWARFIRESLFVELLLAVRIVTFVAEGTLLPFLEELTHDCLVFVRVRCRQFVANRLF